MNEPRSVGLPAECVLTGLVRLGFSIRRTFGCTV